MIFLKKIIISVFLAMLLFGCVPRVFAEDEAQAWSVLDNIEGFLTRAFLAVAEAEKAGANVAGLKANLTSAGGFLAEGETCFRMGNFTGAIGFALLANESIRGVENKALQLTISAKEDWSYRFYWAIFTSSIGVSLTIFVALVSWVYFRRWYIQKVLSLKPEVSQSES